MFTQLHTGCFRGVQERGVVDGDFVVIMMSKPKAGRCQRHVTNASAGRM